MRAATLAFALTVVPRIALGQPCPEASVGCARAPIAFAVREALPGEFDFDSGWVPAGAPVQVRFHAAFAGHTNVSMRGELLGFWPEPMQLEALGAPDGGVLENDYGVEFSARVRLSLDTGPQTFNWEGNIPYVPQINFRATSRQTFEPWGFTSVHSGAMTERQHIADVRLTDAIVRIPGISGGLSFEAQGQIDTVWEASRISFGLAADPITAVHRRTLGTFMGGPSVEYQPVLEGALNRTVGLHVFPSLYVSLLGRRWMLTLADIPLNFGPYRSVVRAGPSIARLDLPDIGAESEAMDFGFVNVGQSAERTLYVSNNGFAMGRVLSGEEAPPFGLTVRPRALDVRSRIGVTVTFRPVTSGLVERTVVVVTNDPDTPRLRVRVTGSGVGSVVSVPVDASGADVTQDASASDGGTTAAVDGGCGCRAVAMGSGGSPVRGHRALFALGLLAVLPAARRRR